MAALWAHFGEEPFERGNLDAGRLSWLFGREVVPAEDPFDPESYEALLRIDLQRAEAAFPEVFSGDVAAPMKPTTGTGTIRHVSAHPASLRQRAAQHRARRTGCVCLPDEPGAILSPGGRACPHPCITRSRHNPFRSRRAPNSVGRFVFRNGLRGFFRL